MEGYERNEDGAVPGPQARLFEHWGRLHCADRAFQMDVLRRTAAGRLAELFGGEALPHDRSQRVLGLQQRADTALHELPWQQKAWLDAYARGVNAASARRLRLSVHHAWHRVRMEPWRPTDSLLISLLLYQWLAFDLSGHRMAAAVRRTVPPAVATLFCPAAGEPAPDAATVSDACRWLAQRRSGRAGAMEAAAVPGSNAWTVATSRSATGAPILACDLHLPPTAPSLLHVVTGLAGAPGFAGAAFPGLPVPVTGANRRVAWGVTNMPGDTLRLLPARDCGQVRNHDERIAVRGTQPVIQATSWTEAGPVWPDPVAGQTVVACWSALWPGSVDVGLAELIWSCSLHDAVETGRRAGGPPLNLHVAAADGGTAQLVSGRVPEWREDGRRGWRLRAWDTLPVQVPGGDGILVSANDAVTKPGGAFGWNHPPAWRARRIREILVSRDDWDERAMAQAQLDVEAGALRPYRDLALRILSGPRPGFWPEAEFEDAGRAVTLWDGTCRAGAVGAVFLAGLRRAFTDRLSAPVLNAARALDPLVKFALRDSDPAVLALLATEDAALLGPQPTWLEACAAVMRDVQVAATQRSGMALSRLRWDARTPVEAQPAWPGWLRAALLPRALPQDGAADCVFASSDSAHPAVRLVASPGRPAQALVATPGPPHEAPLWRRAAHRRWMRGQPSPLFARRART